MQGNIITIKHTKNLHNFFMYFLVISLSVHCFNVIFVCNQLEKYGDILDTMFTLFYVLTHLVCVRFLESE